MSTATRSYSQVASDGVRVAWKATDPPQHEARAFAVQRSMDGVVRVRREVPHAPIHLKRQHPMSTIVLNKWIGTANAVRLPRLGMGA